jgi:hypothetical protein
MDADHQRSSVDPSEQRGGTTPGEQEAADKGPWAAKAAEGVVPAELGGSDSPREMLDDDPELGSSVLGATTGSEEPATEAASIPEVATVPTPLPTAARRFPTAPSPT